jgi:pilus assembly protein CpaB
MDRRRVLLGAAVIIAVLGTLLVFVYVKGADTRANDRYKAVNVLTAVKQINPGETVAAAQAAGKFKLTPVASGQQLPDALTDLTAIRADVATTTIYPGEQIIAAKFGGSASGANLTIPKGMLAISVNLTDPGRVAGFVNPGDNVAVFMSTTKGDMAPGTFTRMVVPSVEVIGVGTTSVVATTTTDGTGASTTDQLPRTLLTLAVDQKDAEKIQYAAQNGELAMGLLTKDSKVAPSGGVNPQNLFR